MLSLQFTFRKNIGVGVRPCVSHMRQIFGQISLVLLLTVRRLTTLANKQTIVSKHCVRAHGKAAAKEFFAKGPRKTGTQRSLVFNWKSVERDLLLSLKGDELQGLSRLLGLQPCS